MTRVPTLHERLLVILLRFGGAVLMLAWLAIFLPTEWMTASHRWLGLGVLPDSPLVQYLTRSVAALYGIHGGLVLLLSTDVRRFAPVIAFMSLRDAHPWFVLVQALMFLCSLYCLVALTKVHQVRLSADP